VALAAAVAVAAAVLTVTPPALAATTTTVQVTDPGFTTVGSWPESAAIGPDGAPTRYSSSTGASASWTFVADEAGIYRAEAAIPDVANSEPGSIYTFAGGSGGPTTTTVDQQATRGSWVQLGWVELEAGDTATLVVSRQAPTTSTNTRAGSARLVPDASGTVPPPLDTGLPYSETWSTGLGGWAALSGSLDDWSIESTEVDALAIENLTANAGSYVRPTAAIELPADYRIRTSVRVDQFAGGNVSVLIDMLSPYSHVAGNTAVQFTGTGVKLARPNSGAAICNGPAPIATGEWFQLEIVRAAGILAVYTNGELVATATAGGSGGTIGLGAYRADAAIGGIGIEELSGAPTGHPTAVTGCSWVPSTGATAAQPIIINQTGFDLGAPKRFTAPHALDGEVFQVIDADDAVVYEGTVASQLGDFSDFDPASTGPYRVVIAGEAGEGESYDFGIGANWTERISYDNAIGFMTGARCFFGELSGRSLNGTDAECKLGLGWRDSHQMSFELPALVDLYFANPSAIGAITLPDAVYEGIEYPTAAGAPEVARLLAWGAEIYLEGQYDQVFLKEQLASFLWAYPEFSEWIPVELYEDVRDYLFPIWSQASSSRYSWHSYTAHTADLLQVYTQIGTGKGEFPPGHSIIPNLRMWEVAQREGRSDARVYLDAAVAQAAWIVDNVDVSDPLVTKGQRQGEYHLMTALATLAAMAPDSVPAGLSGFAEHWAEVAIERSDNMWDFHKYSDDRWTIPSFTGGGSGEDPNESGNLLGFPAAALAASTLIEDPAVDARLAEVAQAQIDNIFGRNPTGRAAQYRVTDPSVAFEGLDLGWFSEYQGGYGLLQGLPGVFDGSPKNGHYPFNPGVQNIGHTEGWVTFTTAWLVSLAWRAYTSTEVTLGAASVPADGSVALTLRAPLNMDAAGGNTGEVKVSVNGAEPTAVTVTQTGVNTLDYTASLDLAELGAREGDTLTVSYGLGNFIRTASLTVTAEGTGPGTDPGEDPPTTTPTVLDPADADPALELESTQFRMVDGKLIAQLGSSAAGQWYSAVVHSTPVQLGWFRADATGQVIVPVPSGLPAGVHTLQLYDASGALVAWGQFTLAAAPDPDLAATGVSIGTAALAVLLAGCAILTGLMLQRRRRQLA
jgi:hypothetical protein